MVLHRDLWIHRQVENLSFLDADRMRRRVSVDFTIPNVDGIDGAGDTVFLPVALLRKHVMKGFDLRDEHGGSLPCTNLLQHNAIVQKMLATAVLGALAGEGEDVSTDAKAVVQSLQEVVIADDPQAKGLWEARCAQDGTPEHEVARNKDAHALIEDLEAQFVLFVPIKAAPGSRRVVKYSLEAPIGNGSSDHRAGYVKRLKRACLLDPWPIYIDAPIAGRARSVHVEVVAPDELAIYYARLFYPQAQQDETIVQMTGPTAIAHLHPNRVPDRGKLVELEVGFVLRRDGFATAGALIALSTTLLLASGVALHLNGIAPRTDAAGAVVVALPALYAPALTISSTHRLVRRIVGKVRALVLTSAALSFIAAASLAAGLEHHDRTWLWVVLLLFSLPSTVIMCTAWAKAPQKPSTEPVLSPQRDKLGV
ncbi:MAG TPA: hypothetical protein VGI52_06580 [Solirubrobacteraceae bacterium]|jgi:hypothetical protein